MPDADIPPIRLSDAEIEEIQQTVPMLPPAYRAIFANLGVDSSVVNKILNDQQYAELMSSVVSSTTPENAKRIANWFGSAISEDGSASDTTDKNLVPDAYVELADMVGKDELSSTAAKGVFNELLSSNRSAREIAEAKNLLQVSDEGAIAAIVDEVLADPANTKAVEDIKAGNDKVIGFLVGQIMKKSQGKANPAMAQKLIREKL